MYYGTDLIAQTMTCRPVQAQLNSYISSRHPTYLWCPLSSIGTPVTRHRAATGVFPVRRAAGRRTSPARAKRRSPSRRLPIAAAPAAGVTRRAGAKRRRASPLTLLRAVAGWSVFSRLTARSRRCCVVTKRRPRPVQSVRSRY